MLRDKKALSTVVTTLIIILLVLVAIGIIWVVIRPVVEGGASQIDVKAKCLNVDVRTASATDCSATSCTITVRRGLDNEEIDGVRVVVSDGIASRISDTVFSGANLPDAGGSITQTFTYDSALANTPNTITIAAFFDINGPQLCSPH